MKGGTVSRSQANSKVFYICYFAFLQMSPFIKFETFSSTEGVVAPWCNLLTLPPEQSGGVGSHPGRAPSLERHDKGSRNRLDLLYFCNRSAWR